MAHVTTQLDIANMALQMLGQARLTSLTDPNNAARAMNFWFDKSAYEALARSAWTFARKQKALSLLTNDRDGIWTYRYDMPSDVVAFKGIVDPSDLSGRTMTTGYLIDSGSIYTHIANAYGRYIWPNTDPSRWPPQFSRAVAYMLARDACVEITKKFSLVDKLEKNAEYWVSMAIQMDASQEATSWSEGNTYIRARGARTNNPWEEPGSNAPDGSQFWEN